VDRRASPAATRFDRIASRYDAWYQHPANRVIDRFERETLQDFLPSGSQGSLLLDVGVGTGHWVSMAREAGYEVIGLDRSADMLRVAASSAGMERSIIQGDAGSLPFPDACFDAVLSVTTLEFLGQPSQAVEEMMRCLRPGGSLVAGVLNAFSFLGFKRKLLRGSTFRGAHFFSVGELRRMLENGGDLRVTTCAFMPPWGWLVSAGERLESLGKALTPRWGQLIVARVIKPGGKAKGDVG
jgi:ubiquinone/menaquinone biosynthesis C-methylase UbiE